MPQVSRDLLVDLWYPGEIKPEPAEPASADGLLYMFLHRDAAGNTRGGVRHLTEKDPDRQGSEQTTESKPIHPFIHSFMEPVAVKTRADYWSVGDVLKCFSSCRYSNANKLERLNKDGEVFNVQLGLLL